MANVRMMPPRKGDRPTIKVHGGRSYTCALGSTIDVPDFDAQVMQVNDWTPVAKTVGATSARPTVPNRGDAHMDTTLGYVVVFDGLVWRNPATGAAV